MLLMFGRDINWMQFVKRWEINNLGEGGGKIMDSLVFVKLALVRNPWAIAKRSELVSVSLLLLFNSLFNETTNNVLKNNNLGAGKPINIKQLLA